MCMLNTNMAVVVVGGGGGGGGGGDGGGGNWIQPYKYRIMIPNITTAHLMGILQNVTA